MTVWLDRAGRYGEQESIALEKGIAVMGWDELPDLSNIETKEQLEALFRTAYPDSKPQTISNWVGQLYSFRHRMKKDDLVILPLKTRSSIAIGRVNGDYQYQKDYPPGALHTRPVKWIRKDIPRTVFDQDLLYMFGACSTVCQIQRNNAEERILAFMKGKPVSPPDEGTGGEQEEIPDLQESAITQIMDHIHRKFKGHELTRLVDEILKAQGYITQRSPAGPDGGVDILAGRGLMGFDPPKLCVQVKSSDSSVDVDVLRSLQGVMKSFGAEQGLLVSWGGFKDSVYKEGRRSFFEIRFWDADKIIAALLDNYKRISEEVRAELPLKRIWTLVLEKEE